ncbi:MAG: hypothetical protein CHACPFDD_01300 [Phycisphaerae bacterium]|nr:hypothetical protein [Phycisphaerae bacterium]
MKTAFHVVCVAAYLLLTVIPAIYGVHMYVLLYLSARKASRVRTRQRRTTRTFQRHTADQAWPIVTTQIPLYNEMAVARRVIEAAARMDYPAGRHEIQVLDDSSDGTCQIVDDVCRELQAQGVDIRAVRRPTREHFKAGALAHGLTTARGEFIAIFDADFVPKPSFLRTLIPLIATSPDAGCVQGRWGHLNADECWMTEALALGIDGHFGVEQSARGWNNLLLNFNGTAGVWRRAAIEDSRVGGWQGDTLTEDLDLSYRAQLAGWRVVYCVDEVCPAEVPADVNAIKTQQRRWAMGSIQTARKLLPAVWRSDLSLLQKLEASVHLTQYSVALFMVLLPLLARPLVMLIPQERYTDWLLGGWLLVLLSCAAPSAAYVYARWSLGGGITGVGRILKLIVLGLGLSVNNCAAVITGAVRRGGEFIRTPKTGSQSGVRQATSYAALRSNLWICELALGLFCFVQWLYFLRSDGFFGMFLLLYAIGLTYFGWHSRPESLMPAARPTAG